MSTGIYARISTDTDEQEHALAQQLQRLRLAAKGQRVIEYIERASGSKDDRRQLNQLLADCHSGRLDTVICTKLDRLSRSVAHGAELLSYFAAQDTPNLIALDDGLDLSTVGGVFVANMLINLAQAEVMRLSERVRHGMADHKQKLRPFGTAPYGYRYTEDRSTFELDPTTAPIARQLVDAFLQEHALLPVLRRFQRCGITTFVSCGGFKDWLLNPTLAGFRVYRKSYKARNNYGKLISRRHPPGEYEELYANAHPALITKLEHAKIHAILANHRTRERSALQTHRVNALTGLVTCAHCGRQMGYQYGKASRYKYMRCLGINCTAPHHNTIRSDTVERAIWDALKGHQQQLLMANMAMQLKAGGVLEQEQQLTQQLRELEARHDPDLSEAIYKKRLRLQQLLDDRNDLGVMEYDPERVAKAFRDERFWEVAQSNPEDKRNLFVQHVQGVLVAKQLVERVELRLPDIHH